jgi:hypothetical protein
MVRSRIAFILLVGRVARPAALRFDKGPRCLASDEQYGHIHRQKGI